MISYIEWAFDEGPDDPIALLVLVRLANHANASGICWPSLPEICAKTRLSESSVRRAIQKLEQQGYLTVVRGRGSGHRSQYQLHRKVAERNLSSGKLSEGKLSDRPEKGVAQTGKGLTQTEPPNPLIGGNDKKPHEPSKANPTAPRGTRIPADFAVTDEHRRFAQEHRLPSPDGEVDRFRDYWRAKAGRDAVKLDWDATFRNWLRNAVQFNGQAEEPRNCPAQDRNDRANAKIDEILGRRGLHRNQTGFVRPDRVSEIAQIIESRFGALETFDPERMVEAASEAGDLAEHERAGVLQLLKSWQSRRPAQPVQRAM